MATAAHDERLELDENTREAIFVTGGDPDNPSALDLRRAQLALQQATTHQPRPLSKHERDYRRLVGFLSSHEAASLDDLEMLIEHRYVAEDAAADELREHIRLAVVKGLISRDIADKMKSLKGSLGCVENKSGMGSRTEALQAIQACHAIMLLLIEVLGHAAMLDPDPNAEPDQGDLVEEARKAAEMPTRIDIEPSATPTIVGDGADEQKGKRIKPAAQVARPQAFPGGKDSPERVDVEEDARRRHEELAVLEPIISDEAKKIARKTFEDRVRADCDFFDKDENAGYADLPEFKRRAIAAEIVDRFGNVDHKAAWSRLLASRDGAAAGEVSNG